MQIKMLQELKIFLQKNKLILFDIFNILQINNIMKINNAKFTSW
ncbi:hypothetical protein MSROBK_006210 [Spiroplasma poulsonii]|uniref:Uncharacterized protein n=1 Tax=Spiroplasma poulsonii TaxID=2138 RepID=A0A2P6FBF0_9MOLU|nr:hypothetical protein MSROBK_006210 [Spiroplasma poulsonii]PQM30795.1 hypothetical protein SMSRO_SF005840 [Spiroplasma poulsonii]PWF95784.1 hypothetical protein SMSE_12210 [Spiroplasma poulsonii]PWF98563.1 hypothetical protein SMH99_11250 [Spiroplasma poulsonii]